MKIRWNSETPRGQGGREPQQSHSGEVVSTEDHKLVRVSSAAAKGLQDMPSESETPRPLSWKACVMRLPGALRRNSGGQLRGASVWKLGPRYLDRNRGGSASPCCSDSQGDQGGETAPSSVRSDRVASAPQSSQGDPHLTGFRRSLPTRRLFGGSGRKSHRKLVKRSYGAATRLPSLSYLSVCARA